MKVTLEKVYVAQQSLTKLLSQDMPSSLAFRLSRLAKQVKSELDTFEENRIKLVKKYSTSGKEKKSPAVDPEQSVKVHPDKMKEFSAELMAMLAVEIELDFEPISVKDLGDVKISAIDLVNIEPFVCE